MPEPALISIVIPVYNEGENIQACLRRLATEITSPHEILICYDFDGDSTLPAIKSMPDCPITVQLIRNDFGRGAANAIRAGFRAARGDVIVTMMADLSDPPHVVMAMAQKIREQGADVVSGSRYMKGGSQTGGPLLKRSLSRLAGKFLHWLTGLKTYDPTNNFRAFNAAFLRQVQVESRKGLEVGLELTVKAHVLGFHVDEVPSAWQDRSAGKSRFRLWAWMPYYLRWVWYAIWGTWFRRRSSTSGHLTHSD